MGDSGSRAGSEGAGRGGQVSRVSLVAMGGGVALCGGARGGCVGLDPLLGCCWVPGDSCVE